MSFEIVDNEVLLISTEKLFNNYNELCQGPKNWLHGDGVLPIIRLRLHESRQPRSLLPSRSKARPVLPLSLHSARDALARADLQRYSCLKPVELVELLEFAII